MGLFSLPPASPREDLSLDRFLKGGNTDEPCAALRRTLPAEWFPQSAVQLTWPHAATDWADMLDEVTDTYRHLAYEIAIREPLLIVAPDTAALQQYLERHLPRRATDNIRYFACPTNDTWARDHAFLTVIAEGKAELLDFRFDGWGGKFEAALDNAINRRLYDAGRIVGTYVDHLDLTLEGGSIESDGRGTLLTTSHCLLHPNRNAALSREALEKRLLEALGAERILWLDHGHLEGDDTDAHIDTLARLCPDDTIVYVSCDNPQDAHYEALRAMEEQLRTFRTTEGTPYRLVAVPLPDAIYDADGERLPATYANFLLINGAVLYPTYRQRHHDEAVRNILQHVFPTYDIVGVDCRSLIRQHGSLHCATMQYPRGVVV